MDNIYRYHNCKVCNKKYKSYKSLWNHNKSFHINNVTINNNDVSIGNNSITINNTIVDNKVSINTYDCIYSNKNFKSRQNKWEHQKKHCKERINNIKKDNSELEIKKIELEKLKEEKEILKLKNIQENANKFNKNLIKYDEMKSIVSDLKIQIKKLEENKEIELNNRFLNIITEKNNTIEEFNKLYINKENKEIVTINQEIREIKSLTFNGVVIVSRSEDTYINATQLCQAGGKQFKNWFRLDITKNLINELASKAHIRALDLVEINKGGDHNGSWIHPKLAIQLAQWISSSFALQVSDWILDLFTNGNVSINIKLQNELKISNSKIKLLEDTYLKKHKRKDYPETNVIYMVTTEANKNKRIYIIGKAKNLKNRLSTYNKTNEHEVIYYKSCKNESTMSIAESIILNKLSKYREKANRDRFVLPLEKNSIFFTDIIDESINFLNLKI
jgi:hypothetical protein